MQRDTTIADASVHRRSGEATEEEETAQSLLADELNKLSFDERETINEEIHGIGVGTGLEEETPQTVEASLRGLRKELDRLCATADDQTAAAFRRARELRASHLDSKEIGIMFLRCERFDCQKAAVRLCRFADLVRDMHGDKGLERWIELSDMSEDEIAIMKQGSSQILPGRDRAGRRVFVHFHRELFSYLPVRTKTRILLYYIQSLVRDDADSQRRGIVVVFWVVQQKLRRDTIHGRFSRSMPCRIGAVHFFLLKSGIFGLARLIAPVLRQNKQQMRLHYGSPLECLYVLESFGISSKEFPLDLGTGQVRVANNIRWLESRAAGEKPKTTIPLLSPKPNIIITNPKREDVLFGKGRMVMYHPGNIDFRRFIKFHLWTYANISGRTKVVRWTKNVVHILQTRYGVRFLKEAPSTGNNNNNSSSNNSNKNGVVAWEEVSNEVARHKVRCAFRDAKYRLLQQQRKNHNNRGSQQKSNDSSSTEPRWSSLPEPSTSSRMIDPKSQQFREAWGAYLAGLEIYDDTNTDRDLYANANNNRNNNNNNNNNNHPGLLPSGKINGFPGLLEQNLNSSTSAFIFLSNAGLDTNCCSSFCADPNHGY